MHFFCERNNNSRFDEKVKYFNYDNKILNPFLNIFQLSRRTHFLGSSLSVQVFMDFLGILMVGIYFWMIFCIIKQFFHIPFNTFSNSNNVETVHKQVEDIRKVGQVFYALVIVVIILSGYWYFQVCREESEAAALSVDQPDVSNTINAKVKRINWKNWLSSIFFFFVGLDLYWYSINYLYDNKNTNNTADDISPTEDSKNPAPTQILVRSGIYAYCRHPAYFSLLLQLAAMSLHTYRPARNILSLLLLVLSFTYFIVFRIPEEDRQLKQTFGASWTTYKRSTTNKSSNCCNAGGIRGIVSYFSHLFDPTKETFQPTQSVQSSPTYKLVNSDISTANKIQHSESADKLQVD